MLNRKIYKKLEGFYKEHPQKALMITGARQVGKSTIIGKFAKEHYRHYIKIDFIENAEYAAMFENIGSARDVYLRLSSLFGEEMVPGETMIFFDEVQECKEIITVIKYLLQDGQYDYILSGSLLGTVMKDLRSVPVGFMEIMPMYPLDFEEFAWANGVGENVITTLKKNFENRTEVDSYLHKRMMSLFELYLMVGGMPAAVQKFLETKNLGAVAREQQAILELYKKDISKYDRDEKLYLNDIFGLIPSELNAKNKRFIMKNLNENAKFAKYNNSFIWLKNAGVTLPCHVANEPKIPLLLSKSSNLLKLYSNDAGLLAAQYGNGFQLQILNHETKINFGAVFENVVATELTAHGFPLYYYNNKKNGEVDFLLENNNRILPLEIKSGKDYYRHNAMDHLLKNKEYDIPEGYVFCNGNVETNDNVVYYPIYMIMFFQKENNTDDLIYTESFQDLNQLF